MISKYNNSSTDINTNIQSTANVTNTSPPSLDQVQQQKIDDHNQNLNNDNDNEKEGDADQNTGNDSGPQNGQFRFLGDGNILMALYDDVMDLLATARELSTESSPGVLNAHSTILNTLWAEFRAVFYQEKAGGKEIPFSYSVLQRKYIEISGKLNDLIKKPMLRPQQCEPSSSIQFNLPKLQLPEFNGKLNDWKRFIALFDRMVHNNTKIDHGIKIEYLKTCVKGQAAKIINHIVPNPDNYLTCYELIRKRFDNKRELMGALIDNILQLPKIKIENAEMLKTIVYLH